MAETADLSNVDLGSSSASDRSVSSFVSNRSLRVAEQRKRRKAEDSFQLAVKYFSEVKAGTPVAGNDVVRNNLELVERAAHSKGLAPEVIAIMLEFAMSLRMGIGLCVRVLKCLIPATKVPQEAIVRAVSWMCTRKISNSAQVLFIKWVLTVFDMIDAKDQLRAIYGFIFSFVTDEELCPYVCHLLYLLTRKENVQLFRVRKLLDLQSKRGRQPFLSSLLSLYKVFCPDLVTVSLPSRGKNGFKNHTAPWKAALLNIQKMNTAQASSILHLPLGVKEQTRGRKRKHGHLELPPLSCAVHTLAEAQDDLLSSRKAVPLAQVKSFSQLLENLHRIELPAQMGSLLGSSPTLHYLDCVQDESAFLRLDMWLGHTLHEEFLLCGNGAVSQSSQEVLQFMDRLLSTQHFLQEGFSSTEVFLYKFLSLWDGTLLRPQILSLLTNIPVITSHYINQVLFEPLMQLFFTSSVFFKCALIDCLNTMLKKWLIWHSVYALQDGLDISINSHTPMNMTLSGFKDSVTELVHFVGRLASTGLQLEGCHSLLLHFILDFYETVSDMLDKYGLPLLVMPPEGVFYPAFLANNPVILDRLAYIMSRYKVNFTTAKNQERKSRQAFHVSSHMNQKFNHYLVFMVSCLWNSRMFQPGTALKVREALLARSKVPQYGASFSIIHHPAFLNYAIAFHRMLWPKSRDMDLNSIKRHWYLEYLFSQGFEGPQQFAKHNIHWRSKADGNGEDGQSVE